MIAMVEERPRLAVVTLVSERVIDGRYRVERRLGSGSMGVVYLAEDVFLGRRVAIKVIDPVNANDPASTERFVKEARALAQIRHDNVVQVYAFGPHQRSFYFAMEYVEGQSLEEAIDRGETVDVVRALEIVRAVANGLGAVHARQLVHRDVKPSNIVIENDTRRPVLIDFGLARRKSASSPKLSITAGTPSYMAPEQATDPDGTRVTGRADIYALACTAFELLTGHAVFEGTDVFEILKAHLKSPPPLLSSRRPDLAVFDAAFVRALAKDPKDRHESAVAFAAELDLALARREATQVKDTLPPRSDAKATGPAGLPGERVLLLAKDEGVAKQITRTAKRSVSASGRRADVAQVVSARELLDAFASDRAGIVVIDDDSSDVPVGELVRTLRTLSGGWAASVLVVSRAFGTTRHELTAHGVRDVLPKPLVVQMLAQAIDRIVLRRSTPDTTMGT